MAKAINKIGVVGVAIRNGDEPINRTIMPMTINRRSPILGYSLVATGIAKMENKEAGSIINPVANGEIPRPLCKNNGIQKSYHVNSDYVDTAGNQGSYVSRVF